ncbi:MAG: helix-turn-helix domain-containing protein, partial [Anaeroplasmataceae bacterium]|nr:helix-turn-helix domain-containing protein [Anaeroplasmataceae bacterium]
MINFILVGEKLAKYRKESGLTQDEVAERLFVTRQLVSKWENGTGIPSIDCLLELCKLYQKTFEDILCL